MDIDGILEQKLRTVSSYEELTDTFAEIDKRIELLGDLKNDAVFSFVTKRFHHGDICLVRGEKVALYLIRTSDCRGRGKFIYVRTYPVTISGYMAKKGEMWVSLEELEKTGKRCKVLINSLISQLNLIWEVRDCYAFDMHLAVCYGMDKYINGLRLEDQDYYTEEQAQIVREMYREIANLYPADWEKLNEEFKIQ